MGEIPQLPASVPETVRSTGRPSPSQSPEVRPAGPAFEAMLERLEARAAELEEKSRRLAGPAELPERATPLEVAWRRRCTSARSCSRLTTPRARRSRARERGHSLRDPRVPGARARMPVARRGVPARLRRALRRRDGRARGSGRGARRVRDPRAGVPRRAAQRARRVDRLGDDGSELAPARPRHAAPRAGRGRAPRARLRVRAPVGGRPALLPEARLRSLRQRVRLPAGLRARPRLARAERGARDARGRRAVPAAPPRTPPGARRAHARGDARALRRARHADPRAPARRGALPSSAAGRLRLPRPRPRPRRRDPRLGRRVRGRARAPEGAPRAPLPAARAGRALPDGAAQRGRARLPAPEARRALEARDPGAGQAPGSARGERAPLRGARTGQLGHLERGPGRPAGAARDHGARPRCSAGTDLRRARGARRGPLAARASRVRARPAPARAVCIRARLDLRRVAPCRSNPGRTRIVRPCQSLEPENAAAARHRYSDSQPSFGGFALPCCLGPLPPRWPRRSRSGGLLRGLTFASSAVCCWSVPNARSFAAAFSFRSLRRSRVVSRMSWWSTVLGLVPLSLRCRRGGPSTLGRVSAATTVCA